MKYTCLVFGEGGQDRKFLIALCELDKFKYHIEKWTLDYDNASGNSPEVILDQCRRVTSGKSYDLVICFIDLDKLKHDYPSEWEKKKVNLEQKFLEYKIIWQTDNKEEEMKIVLGDIICGKHRLNELAIKNIKKFINSDFWKRILKVIKDKENELEQK
jgi:hypothetical protein